MQDWLPIFYLMVILKIPVGALLYIVWWAFRAEVAPEEAPEQGEEDTGFRRFRREPKRPRGPRRGPHAPDAAPIPGDSHDGRRSRKYTPPVSQPRRAIAPARRAVRSRLL